MPTREQQRQLDTALNSFFTNVERQIEEGVVPAFIKGNLQLQSSEGIRPSFQIAQTSARDWYKGYKYQLEQGGGNIWNRETEEYDWVPWMEEWKQETRTKFAEVIDDAMDEGWSIDQTSEEIQDLLGVESVRGDRIARTEIARAMFYGRMARAKQAGYTQVRWKAAPARGDIKVCDDCAALDEQVFDIDAIPEQPLHPNCRCTFQPVLSSLRFPSERFPKKVRPMAVEVPVPEPTPPAPVILSPQDARKKVREAIQPLLDERKKIQTTLEEARTMSHNMWIKKGDLEREYNQLKWDRAQLDLETVEGEKKYRELTDKMIILSNEMIDVGVDLERLDRAVVGAEERTKNFQYEIRNRTLEEIYKATGKNPSSVEVVLTWDETKRDYYFSGTVDPNWKRKVTDELNLLLKMNKNPRINELLKAGITIIPETTPDGGSYYRESDHTLHLDVRDKDPAVPIHEVMHHVELSNRQYKARSLAILMSRVPKRGRMFHTLRKEFMRTSKRKSSTIGPGWGKDKFVISGVSKAKETDPQGIHTRLAYMGRLYFTSSFASRQDRIDFYKKGILSQYMVENPEYEFRSSEILSQGGEMFFSNPVYLMERDPEIFDYIYSILMEGAV